jgi:hypothetical protein
VGESRLVVTPAIAGRGDRLPDADGVPDHLDLVDIAWTPRGTPFLHYRRRS